VQHQGCGMHIADIVGAFIQLYGENCGATAEWKNLKNLQFGQKISVNKVGAKESVITKEISITKNES
jgi:hypothetical protein